MDRKKAEKIVRDICSKFMGTLEDHRLIQQALGVVFNEKEKEQIPEENGTQETS